MSDKYYDWVIYNANIITMDPNKESAEMLGVKGEEVTYIGEFRSKILEKAISSRDAEGKAIIPGFIDLHTHLWTEAHVISIDLGSFKTYEDVIRKLETEVKTRKPGEWVFASNWDESKWQDRKEFLTREALDAISPQNPLYTHREDGHLVVANSLALEKLPIPKSHPGVEIDSSGKPTGVLKDVWLDLSEHYKHLLPESIEKSTLIAASKGITTVVDNLTIMPDGQKNIIQVYFNLDMVGKLPIRIFLNITHELMDEFTKLGLTQNWGSSKVRFSGFKGFFDGALGAHTALISHPYQDAEGRGDQFLNEEELISQVVFAEKNNHTLCIHAIGDLAIEKLLHCYEKGIKGAGKSSSSRQHRIEHAEMVTDDQIRKAKNLGILLSMQPNFLKWEYPGGLYEHRLGKDRFMTLNRFATIHQNGVKIYFGSDNMPLSPLYGIQQAISFPSPEVKLSINEAIQSYTINNAQALFMEAKLGSITEGKYADFVIMSKSPLEIDSSKINDNLIEQTIVGGKEVYSSKVQL
ncbi:MAG: amidohydrolase [Candidatus Heimdallarchaeota archaeon]|nr:MAG: amidohydrolase [Candidatus Heimdallarchaeota archaeon]